MGEILSLGKKNIETFSERKQAPREFILPLKMRNSYTEGLPLKFMYRIF